jgi:hypothetical protein
LIGFENLTVYGPTRAGMYLLHVPERSSTYIFIAATWLLSPTLLLRACLLSDLWLRNRLRLLLKLKIKFPLELLLALEMQ